MRVLIISPKCAKRVPEVYNVGLAYVGAALKADGHEVELLDFNTHHIEATGMLDAIRAKGRPDAIALGTLVTAFSHVRWLVDELKRMHPDVPVWAGNSVASTIPEIFIRNVRADVAVIGEGEVTVRELASGKKPLDDIKGIVFMRDGNVVKTPPREPIEDLDALPFPAYDLFNQEIYMSSSLWPGGIRRLLMLGASVRGCPYHCTYCYHSFQGLAPRYHSAKRMMDELERAAGMYEFDAFSWADDLMISSRRRTLEFCDLYERSGMRRKWISSARVNLVDEELLRRMKSAGCVYLGFGVESGSQKILDNIKKNVTVAQAEKALALCKKVGINFGASLMIGNQGETRQTVMETVEFTRRNRIYVPTLFIATPYPQTELYEQALRNGKIKDELALIESYGEQAVKLLVNSSDMSDDELLSMKAEAEAMMRKDHLRRQPLAPLSERWRLFMQLVRLAGWRVAGLRALQTIIRALTGNRSFRLKTLDKLTEGKVMIYD